MSLYNWLHKFLSNYYDDRPLPDVSELPVVCKNCRSPEYYKGAYTDDIDIVCGVCNHTAGVLPGYGYDPITC